MVCMSAENKKNSDLLIKLKTLEASEKKLREEKEYLERLISNSLDCIVQSDVKGIIKSVNRAFVDMTGFKKEEILGKTPKFLAPVSEGEFESVTGERVVFDKSFFDTQKNLFTEELFKKGSINKLKTAVLRKDGKVIPVEENIFLLYGKKGEIVGSAAIIRDVAARKKTTEALRRARDFLDNMFEKSIDAILLSDETSCILRVNKAFLDLVGYSEDEVVGKKVYELSVTEGSFFSTTGRSVKIDETFYKQSKNRIEELFEKGSVTGWETYFLRKDKKIVPVEQNIVFLLSDQGERISTLAVIRDITERKKAEEELKNHRDNLDELVKERTKELGERECQLSKAYEQLVSREQELKAVNEQLEAGNQQLLASEISLRESEKNFRRLVETMNEGLVVLDKAGQISYVNEKFCLMTGYESDQVKGCSIKDFLDEADQKTTGVLEMLFSSKGSISSDSYEVEWITKDKKKVPVIISPEAIIDEESGFMGTFAVLTDITAIKEADGMVREARDFLENIFGSARDGIIITDIKGTILRINKSVERIFGFTKDEMIGEYLTEFMPQGEKYRILGRGFADKLQGKGFLDIFETFYMKKNKDITPCECNITLLNDDDGQPTGAVVILRDITERKLLEQQFLQTEKLSSLGELAGGVAHDFNNVLSAILGRAQLLMRSIDRAGENKDPQDLLEEITASLKVIEKASLDGADTVHRIMKFARKEKTGEFIHINMNDIINDALEFTRPRWKFQAQAKGVVFTIKKDLSDSSLYVLGNGAELREVITNILNNAFDAMLDGGEIFIRSFIEEGFVVVELSDTGKGIEQDILDKIFDPFFTTKGPKSTGLGMSVSYGIIEQHSGTIKVDSIKDEKTVFTIRLPLSEKAADKKERLLSVAKQEKVKILIIEDEKCVCEMFEDMLVGEGHDVEIAYDGKQGLAVFRKKKFDLVFTDLAMPGISGWQVAKEIKKMDHTVPVILTTGWELKFSEENDDKKNVDIIIKKPFTVKEIASVMQEVLTRRGKTYKND